MVIHKFNKLIRNKWLWGAFAIAISLFFAFDFLIADIRNDSASDESSQGDAGTLAGEVVDASAFKAIVEDVRGFGRQQDWSRDAGEVNREAWERYAALKVAEKDGLEVSDGELRNAIRNMPAFQENGAFSFNRYQMVLGLNGLTDARFEEMQKRVMTLGRMNEIMLSGACWASPIELDQRLADATDVLNVRVAKFSQEKTEADAVKVDEAAIRRWYDANTNSIALPERMKIRYVKFDATDPKVLARMSVSEDEMRDRYDATIEKYTSTDTNGVETVKKFEEVKDGIEKDLRRIAAVTFFETNVNYRVYAVSSIAGASRLDEIAKEDGLKVSVSDWFSTESAYVEGFMKHNSQILPGAQDFTSAIAQLDPTSEDLRYAVVSSDRAVWLVEKSETSAPHIPTFDEAKALIQPRVLRDAKADAFKAKVEAIAAKGASVVLAGQDVSTNIVFSVSDLRQGLVSFDNAYQVARAATKLSKGEVSEFTLLSPGRALLVVCEDRTPGDAAKAMILRSQTADELTMMQMYKLPDEWRKWNLERMGYATGEISSTERVETEE